ncbi:hypothetical protein BT96DRAFT_685613 [Gymnopus androsaceus JB14]|uniref:Uncharacterized protein n=1 Tax=Gymnopus androsaceus JB14 TaxID=1447944 RepID=A0A6A4GEY5_9AGAR|nr:hypothetical protein BT96DRAFT_685613 [Gymnopus androsaceus JB14]
MSLNSNKEQSYYISRRRQLQPVAPSPLETYNPHSKLWFRSSPMFQSKHRPLLTKELAIPSRIDEVSCWRNTTLSRHAEVRFIILKISSSPPNAFNSLDVQAYNAQRRNESVQILNHAISVIDELAVMLSAGERHDFDLSSSEELVLCRRVTKDCWYTSLRDVCIHIPIFIQAFIADWLYSPDGSSKPHNPIPNAIEWLGDDSTHPIHAFPRPFYGWLLCSAFVHVSPCTLCHSSQSGNRTKGAGATED